LWPVVEVFSDAAHVEHGIVDRAAAEATKNRCLVKGKERKAEMVKTMKKREAMKRRDRR
jgi:hypothetical protein